MIAYFALLSLRAAVFLALALLGFAGRADESSYLVASCRACSRRARSARSCTSSQRSSDNATTLGLIGAGASCSGRRSRSSPCWSRHSTSSTGGRTGRSSAARALGRAAHGGSLITLFLGARRRLVRLRPAHAPRARLRRQPGRRVRALAAGLVAVDLRLPRRRLRPADEHAADDPRGAAPARCVATVLLQVSFQSLPIYLRLTRDVIALQAFGGLPLLLVWLYVMANVIVLGAELNWWLRYGRGPQPPRPRRRRGSPSARSPSGAPGRRARGASCARFHSSPSSATVRSSPSRDEDRVVAEALAAPRLAGDPALERARCHDELAAVGGERDELADVAGAAVASTPFSSARSRPPRVARGEARRLHARGAAEPRHLDPGVLAQHPRVARDEPTAEARLDASVVEVGVAVLRREVPVSEQLELPVRQRRARAPRACARSPTRGRPSRVPLDAAHVLEVLDVVDDRRRRRQIRHLRVHGHDPRPRPRARPRTTAPGRGEPRGA